MPTAPNVGATDAPTVLIEISEFWRSHLLGMIERGANPEYWSGTESEKAAASSEFEAVIEAVMAGTARERIGEIKIWAGATLPENWLWCDGFIYTRDEYPELYDAIHVDLRLSETAFKIPDLRQRFPLGAFRSSEQGPGVSDYFGDIGGAANHTLTAAEMPIHSHAPALSGHQFTTYTTAAGGFRPATAGGAYNIVPGGGATTAQAGGGQTHNNMPPYVNLYYAIVAR